MFIEKGLKDRYNYIINKYGENHIMGIYVYGSQNYKLNTLSSDIDTKAIYIPSMMEIVLNKTPVSKELTYTDGSHIEVKDIRLMYNMWQKQNINFIEILYTNYYIINPNYQYYWNGMAALRDDMTKYNPRKIIDSIIGQALNTIKAEEISAKKYVNAYRLLYFLEKYVEDVDYINCIVMPDILRKTLLDIKLSDRVYSQKEVEYIKEGFNQLKKLDLKVDLNKQKELDNKFAYIISKAIERYEELNI